jgi:hypothetical protein
MMLTPGREGVLCEKALAGDRRAEVIPLTYGRARLCLVDRRFEMTYQDVW